MGVEIATSAHDYWLRRHGLLDETSRLVASRCLRSDRLLQGLVIDDYFAASIEDRKTDNSASRAAACYNRSQLAYEAADLLGSPAKDVVGENEGKLVGAYINSSERTLKRKLCTVGAPAAKRIALSFITLALCSLGCTTDVLHLCLIGGWVSILAFRRPMMSILAKCYHLVDQNAVDANTPKLVNLPRSVANELVILACLVPLAISDLGAEYFPVLFATDASSFKGAICWAPQEPRVLRTIWKSCRSKGSYTRLLSPAEQVLRNNGLFDEEKLQGRRILGPDRPLAYEFDFIEVFSGASLVTAAIAAKGWSVGPPLDIGISQEYDLSSVYICEWLTFFLAEKRIKGVMISPPCTTFSIMRRPRLRSLQKPFDFDTTDEQTLMGNTLGQRGAQIMYTAAANDAAGIMETTYSSYLKYLPGWLVVKSLQTAEEVRCDSCAFGSEHLKPFRFLGVNVSLALLAQRCSCSCNHVRIQGALTKASATYVPKLVEAIANCLHSAMLEVHRRRAEALDVDISGLENQLVNEAALASKWEILKSWTFRKQSHINILEEAAVLRLVNFLATYRRPLRASALVDSFVVRGATSKGRSSSRGLSTILRSVGATCVAAALYLTLPYVPTRWNPADDPTRDAVLRPSYGNLDFENWDDLDLFLLSELPKTKRWASLWMRMVLRLIRPACLHFSDRSLFRQTALTRCEAKGHEFGQKGFDSSLGFPGEGPATNNQPQIAGFRSMFCILLFGFPSSLGLAFWALLHSLFFVPATWIAAVLRGVLCLFSASPRGLWFSVGLLACVPAANAMPIFPRIAGERSKAAMRQSRPPVPSGRPVLPVTMQRRKQLLDAFFIWATEQGLDIAAMFEDHQKHIDDLNLVLEKFGRALYEHGKSYGKYAETLNAIISWKPAIRRMLQGAWDFGFAWNRHEPSLHHVAMPGPIALAILTTSMLWGWTRFAGVFALMWAGLLRPGELLSAYRSDLLLPSDGDKILPFGLLAIRDPKTRFSNARHQSAKLDMADMLKIIELFLSPLQGHQRLWPYSGSTLRSRFHAILQALQLPLDTVNGVRPLELASVRAGAATWVMQTTESGDLLQRRGRWANRRMMDIYVQEVTALVYLKRVPEHTKNHVLMVSDSFLQVLAKAELFTQARIPPSSWFVLFRE